MGESVGQRDSSEETASQLGLRALFGAGIQIALLPWGLEVDGKSTVANLREACIAVSLHPSAPRGVLAKPITSGRLSFLLRVTG